jgi:large subunit ribosomal protein L15
MFNLNTLPKSTYKKSKRLGRGLGSGKGSKSGRGTTRHQTARTDIPLHFEGGQGRIVKKYPLLRGKSKNKSTLAKPFALRLSKLLSLSHDGIIDIKVLKRSSVVPAHSRSVKVVFDGDIEKSLKLNLPVSLKVREAVIKANGTIE